MEIQADFDWFVDQLACLLLKMCQHHVCETRCFCCGPFDNELLMMRLLLLIYMTQEHMKSKDNMRLLIDGLRVDWNWSGSCCYKVVKVCLCDVQLPFRFLGETSSTATQSTSQVCSQLIIISLHNIPRIDHHLTFFSHVRLLIT